MPSQVDCRTRARLAIAGTCTLLLLGAGAFTEPLASAIVDLDLDGHADEVSIVEGLIAVSLGDGVGGFLPPRSYEAGRGPAAIAVADFDGDGILDLAVSGGVDSAGAVSVLLGVVDVAEGHSFSEPASYPVEADLTSLGVADVDGDGSLDIVVGAEGSSVSLRGAGDGSFSPTPEAREARASDGPPADAPRPEESTLPAGPLALLDSPGIVGGVSAALAGPAADAPVAADLFDGSCPRPSFTSTSFRVNGQALGWRLAAGDWDGDGEVDLFAVDDDELTEVYLAGNGTFVADDPPLWEQAGSFPHFVIARDVDLDGDLDVVVVNQGSGLTGDVRVIYGDGSGGVDASPAPLPVGELPEAGVATDLDGDGHVDLAVTNYDSETLTVYYGQGSRAFGGATTESLAGSTPVGVVAGDFREDGLPDLLVADDSGSVLLLTGNGAGFDAPVVVPGTAAATSRWLVAGRFNPDLTLDAVALNASGSGQLLVGNGDGTFTVSAAFSVACGFSGPGGVGAGDLNGDDVLDVVVSCADGEPAAVLLGTGAPAGGFGSPTVYSAGTEQYGVVVHELNGDGLDDVAVGGFPGARVFLSSPAGDGALDEPYRPGLPLDAYGARLHDLDSNGTLDLISVATDDDEVMVALGSGTGTFGPADTYAVGAAPAGGLAIGDFDGDGRPDLAVGDSLDPGDDDVYILLNDPGDPGTFVDGGSFGANDNPGQMVAGFFDADADLDLAVVNDGLDVGVSVFLGNGDGTFAAGPFIADPDLGDTAAPRAIAVGSVNSTTDSIPDLVVTFEPSTEPAYFRVLTGDGTGGFTIGPKVELGDPFTTRNVVIGLITGDANPDVAVAGGGFGAGAVAVAAGDGLGGMGAVSTYDLAGLGSGLATGNWDGAAGGQLQLAVAEFTAESVAFTLTSGLDDPVFRYALDGTVGELAAGDLNGDGRPDLVVVEERLNANEIAVLYNTNCLPRRLRIDGDLDVCPTPGGTLPSLAVRTTDDTGSTVADAADSVDATLLNAAGASLGGTPSINPTLGVATFSNLTVSLAGRGYRLGFDSTAARTARTPTFSQGISSLPLGISGPGAVCSFDSPVTYQTAVGYDSYAWTLDASRVDSVTSIATLGSIPAGPHTLGVTVTQDSCVAAGSPFPLSSANGLSSVTASPGGARGVPVGGSGGSVTAVTTGGGSSTFQWGYRVTSGTPPIVPISGATGSSYGITAADFGGGAPGTYYLVVVATPFCGPTLTSNEVEVTVYTPTGNPADAVEQLTATARNDRVTLEWINPAVPYVANRIRYTEGASCVAPADLTEGNFLVRHVGAVGKAAYTDLGLAGGVTRCYSVFVEKPGPEISPGRSIEARTIDTGEGASWAFSTGMAVVTPPGVGGGRVYLVSNDSRLYSIVGGGAGGVWAPGWTPKAFVMPTEGRPTSIPLSAGANPVIYLGSDDGAGGGLLHATNALTGGDVWASVPLPDPIMATPSAIFTEFFAVTDLILVGTRNPGGFSSFYARDPSTGGPVWQYSGEVANRIGLVNAQASVDYRGDRVYFTSNEYLPGHDTVWCLELATGVPCSPWTPPTLGSLDTSPLARGTALYVAPADATVRALDTADGSQLWSFPTADGVVKEFVFPAFGTQDLYFSTGTKVWGATDLGNALQVNWATNDGAYPLPPNIPNPSTPALAVERAEVWVGGGDGRLYRLDAGTGAEISPSVLLAGGVQLGSPTVDRDGGYVYVGAVDGRVFAVPLP